MWTDNKKRVSSLAKVFKVLELLSIEKEALELAVITKQLGFPKTTIHSILNNLKSIGYVEQNPETNRYAASMKLFRLGWEVVKKLNLIEVAHPHMVELSEKTGETVSLGIKWGLNIMIADTVESKHQLKYIPPIGFEHRAYCSACGKAVLAFMGEEEKEKLFANHTPVPSTEKSLKTVKAIMKDLEKVRERGYAVDDEENVMGIRCVGAPIFAHYRNMIFCLSISGPSLRINENNIPHLGGLVMETAASISSRLGA